MSFRRTINQHEGLRPNEHKRRYRRFLEPKLGNAFDWGVEQIHGEEESPCDEPDCPCHGHYLDHDDLLSVLRHHVLAQASRSTIEGVLPESLQTRLLPRAKRAKSPPVRTDPDALPPMLFAHVERLIAHTDARERLCEQVCMLDGLPDAFRWLGNNNPLLAVAALFLPFWVRPLDAWVPPDEGNYHAAIDSLLTHLFELYPVPAPVRQPWHIGVPTLKDVCWLILFGQGASLHRAASLPRWCIARGFAHHLYTAPPRLPLIDACMWAEIMRLGGSRVEFDRIRRNPSYVLDPTESSASASWCLWPDERQADDLQDRRATFWRQTVAWLIQYRDTLTDTTCDLILMWAMHRHTEDLRVCEGEQGAFTLLHRTPASAHEAARLYQRTIKWPYCKLRWSAHGWDWQAEDAAEPKWTICELISGHELYEEGEAMRHCVAQYASQCFRNESAIFSLRANGRRRVTIELDPRSRRVVQAQGPCNSRTKPEESAAIARWLAAIANVNTPPP